MTVTIVQLGADGAAGVPQNRDNDAAANMAFYGRLKRSIKPGTTSQLGHGPAVVLDADLIIDQIKALTDDQNLVITLPYVAPVPLAPVIPRVLKVYADASDYGAVTMHNVAMAIRAGVLHEMAKKTQIYIIPEDFCYSDKSTKLFTEAEIKYVERELQSLAGCCREMVVVTGTLMWKNATHYGKRAFALVGGELKIYDKSAYVSGDDANLGPFERTELKPFLGNTPQLEFVFAGMKYVLHICSDAGRQVTDADLQLVVANGFGALPINGVHARGTSIIVDVADQSIRIKEADAAELRKSGDHRFEVTVQVKAPA